MAITQSKEDNTSNPICSNIAKKRRSAGSERCIADTLVSSGAYSTGTVLSVVKRRNCLIAARSIGTTWASRRRSAFASGDRNTSRNNPPQWLSCFRMLSQRVVLHALLNLKPNRFLRALRRNRFIKINWHKPKIVFLNYRSIKNMVDTQKGSFNNLLL